MLRGEKCHGQRHGACRALKAGALGLYPEGEETPRDVDSGTHGRSGISENSGSSFHSSQCSQFPDEETEGLSRANTSLKSSGCTVSNSGFSPGSLLPHPAYHLESCHGIT